MRIHVTRDRVQAFTRRLEWMILRTGDTEGRAPCVITDVRLRRRPWSVLVADTGGPGPTINNPTNGGLAGVGFVACVPANGREPDPRNFWNEAWEITTRGPARGGGYGYTNLQVTPSPDGLSTITASCDLLVAGRKAMHIDWRYTFDEDDQVDVELRITPLPVSGMFVKEAKAVFNGLQHYRQLTVSGAGGNVLSRWQLAQHGNPRAHTVQIADPDRRSFLFEAPDSPPLRIELDNILNDWLQEADQAPPMSPNAIRADGTFGPAAAYCLTHEGHLWGRSEVPRWADPDVCGLLVHGSGEGGYGAPDCWNCFRPVTLSPQTIRGTISIG